jgi:hypothetical protein
LGLRVGPSFSPDKFTYKLASGGEQCYGEKVPVDNRTDCIWLTASWRRQLTGPEWAAEAIDRCEEPLAAPLERHPDWAATTLSGAPPVSGLDFYCPPRLAGIK